PDLRKSRMVIKDEDPANGYEYGTSSINQRSNSLLHVANQNHSSSQPLSRHLGQSLMLPSSPRLLRHSTYPPTVHQDTEHEVPPSPLHQDSQSLTPQRSENLDHLISPRRHSRQASRQLSQEPPVPPS